MSSRLVFHCDGEGCRKSSDDPVKDGWFGVRVTNPAGESNTSPSPLMIHVRRMAEREDRDVEYHFCDWPCCYEWAEKIMPPVWEKVIT